MQKLIKKTLLIFMLFTYWFTGSFDLVSYAFADNSSLQSFTSVLNNQKLSDEHFVPFATKIHVVSHHENIASLCKYFHLSTKGFFRLNPEYNHNNIYENIKAGTVLTLPIFPLTAQLSILFDQDNETSIFGNYLQKTARAIAENASKTTQQTEKNVIIDTIKETSAQIISQSFSDKISSWLNHYGTAQLSFNVDDHFALHNIAFDMLLPLSDRKNNLFFTQFSIHDYNNKKQANFGLGLRYFSDHFLMGLNSFLDYDLQEGHLRDGIGIEYGLDYVHLAANYYHRLSDWKDCLQDNYDARPANGFDIRANAYLPFYPAIGINFVYEHYYGEKVALIDDNILEKNPSSQTIGVNYTPFPLLSFSADYRRNEKKHNLSLNAQLNYHLGVDLKDQLDPDSVNSLRTLSGSRYDLVQRNNTIILEYERHHFIHITLPKIIEVHYPSAYIWMLDINSQFGIKKIDIDKTAILQAGGKIEKTGTSLEEYTITPPAYRSDDANKNEYPISVTVTDTKNNISQTAHTKLRVLPPLFDTKLSHMEPENAVLKADGHSHKTFLLRIIGAKKQPFKIDAKEIKLKIDSSSIDKDVQGQNKKSLKNLEKEGIHATVSEPVEVDKGIFNIKVVAGTLQEKIIITPYCYGKALANAEIAIVKNIFCPEKSTLSVSPETIQANGVDTAKITLSARDVLNKKLTNLKDKLSFSLEPVEPHTHSKKFVANALNSNNFLSSDDPEKTQKLQLSAIEETDGVYTATLKGTKAGTYKINACYENQKILIDRPCLITLKPGDINHKLSTISAKPEYIIANSIDMALITFTPRDENGNLLKNLGSHISFHAKHKRAEDDVTEGVCFDTITEDQKHLGTYKATFSGTKAGTYYILPAIDGKIIEVDKAAYVELLAGPFEKATSEMHVSHTYILGDNKDKAVISFIARDRENNPITTLNASLSFALISKETNEEIKEGISLSTINAVQGIYTATIKGKAVGHYSIIAAIDHKQTGHKLDFDIKPLPFANADCQISIHPEKILANGENFGIITFKASKNGHFISGFAERLHFIAKNSSGAIIEDGINFDTTTQVDNAYNSRISGTKTGEYQIYCIFDEETEVCDKGVKITFIPQSPDKNALNLEASKAEISSGEETSLLTLTLKDQDGVGINHWQKRLKFQALNEKGEDSKESIHFTPISNPDSGVYETNFSGEKAGTYAINVFLDKEILPFKKKLYITISAGTPKTEHSVFSSDQDYIFDDNITYATLRFKAYDAHHNPVKTLQNRLSFKAFNDQTGEKVTQNIRFSPIEKDPTEAATYISHFYGTARGHYRIEVFIDNEKFVTIETVKVEIRPLCFDKDTATISVHPSTIRANGHEIAQIKLVLKQRNILATGLSKRLHFILKDDANHSITKDIHIGRTSEEEHCYTASLTALRTGKYKIYAYFDKADFLGHIFAPIEILEPQISEKNTSLESDREKIAADGEDIAHLTFRPKDPFGYNISNLQKDLSFIAENAQSGKIEQKVVIDEIKVDEKDPTLYHAQLHGDVLGLFTIIPVYKNNKILLKKPCKVTLEAGKADENNSSLTSQYPYIYNDSKNFSLLTLRAFDKKHNPVNLNGDDLYFHAYDAESNTLIGKDISFKNIHKDLNTSGIYYAEFSGKRIGKYQIIPVLKGKNLILKNKVFVTIKALNLNDLIESFTLEPQKIEANNKETANAVLTLKNQEDIQEDFLQRLHFSVLNSEKQTEKEVFVDAIQHNGTQYSVLIHGTKPGLYTVQPYFDKNISLVSKAETLEIVQQEIDNSKSEFSAKPIYITAGERDKSLLTFAAKDKMGCPIDNLQDSLQFSVTENKLSQEIIKKSTILGEIYQDETEKGVYHAQFYGKIKGKYKFQPLINNTPILLKNDPVIVEIRPGAMDPDTTQLKANPSFIVKSDKSFTTLTLIAKDAFGNSIDNLTEHLKFVAYSQENNTVIDAIRSDNLTKIQDKEGVYTAQIYGLKTGKYFVYPEIDGQIIKISKECPLEIADTWLDKTSSIFKVTPNSIIANGTDNAEIFLQAKRNGTVLTGYKDHLSFEVRDINDTPVSQDVKLSSIKEEDNSYRAKISGTKIGYYTLHAFFDREEITPKEPLEFKIKPEKIDTKLSSLTAQPNKVTADNKKEIKLSFSPKTAQGKPITNLKSMLCFTVKNKDNIVKKGVTLSPFVEEKPGLYTMTFKGTVAGIYQIFPVVDGKQVTLTTPCTVNLVPGTFDSEKCKFYSDRYEMDLSDKNEAIITAILQDANNNAIIKQYDSKNFISIAISRNGETPIYTHPLLGDNFDDMLIQFRFSFKPRKDGIYTIRLLLNNKPIPQVNKVLTIKVTDKSYLPFDEKKSTLKILGFDRKKSTFKVELYLCDSYGDPVNKEMFNNVKIRINVYQDNTNTIDHYHDDTAQRDDNIYSLLLYSSNFTKKHYKFTAILNNNLKDITNDFFPE